MEWWEFTVDVISKSGLFGTTNKNTIEHIVNWQGAGDFGLTTCGASIYSPIEAIEYMSQPVPGPHEVIGALNPWMTLGSPMAWHSTYDGL